MNSNVVHVRMNSNALYVNLHVQLKAIYSQVFWIVYTIFKYFLFHSSFLRSICALSPVPRRWRKIRIVSTTLFSYRHDKCVILIFDSNQFPMMLNVEVTEGSLDTQSSDYKELLTSLEAQLCDFRSGQEKVCCQYDQVRSNMDDNVIIWATSN